MKRRLENILDKGKEMGRKSLTFDNTENDTDRNISLVAGWNLIGYDGDINVSLADATFHDGSQSYTWANAVSNNKLKNYLSYYDSSSTTASERRFKYLGPANVDDTAFRRNKGYWLYANEAGNLTLPGVGGSTSGQTYDWNKLRFSNGTDEMNIIDAGDAGWVETTLQYWTLRSGPTPYYGFARIDDSGVTDSKTSISSGEGVFVNSLKDNLILIRQN